MRSCSDIEPELTAYVDGECAPVDRAEVEAHLATCPRCRAKVATERAAHEALRARCTALRGAAPDGLRQRCVAQRHLAARRAGVFARSRWVPLSLAASLVLAAGVFLLFGWGSSVETYAAQLAADHIKCTQLSSATTSGDVDALGRQWQDAYGWPLRIAPSSSADDLELVGIRRCGSTEGRVAHVLYRWRGRPLSVYVLNGSVEDVPDASLGNAAPAVVKKFGEQELLWSHKGRTYAMVASAPVEDLQQVARYIRPRVE